MTRITRDRFLTPDEAAKYKLIRQQVEADLPDLIAQHHKRMNEQWRKHIAAPQTFVDKFRVPSCVPKGESRRLYRIGFVVGRTIPDHCPYWGENYWYDKGLKDGIMSRQNNPIHAERVDYFRRRWASHFP